MSEIQIKIQEYKQKLEAGQKIKVELDAANAKINELERELKSSLIQLEVLHTEIEKLSSFSLSGMIKAVFVDKETALENKRNEYYTLSKHYDELKNQKSILNFEIDILKGKKQELDLLEQQLKALVTSREEELLNSNLTEGLTLRKVHEDIGENALKIGQLNDLINIADNILQNLTILNASLRDIESTLVWNRRRNSRSVYEKPNKIRRAKELNVATQLKVSEFERKLNDQDVYTGRLGLSIIQFENEFGIFFDNIISDVILKKRLAEAVSEIDVLYHKVNNIKSTIVDNISILKTKKSDLDKVKEKILLS